MIRCVENFCAERYLVEMACGQEKSPPLLHIVFLCFFVACSSPTVPADPVPTTPRTTTAPLPLAVPPTSAPSTIVPVAPLDIPPKTHRPPTVSKTKAISILFTDGAPNGACTEADDQGAIRCLIEKRYEGELSTKTLALTLFDDAGHIAGVEAEHMMDGGFRGTIHIVPELPVRQYKKHLEWVTASANDFNVFFDKLAAKTQSPLRYRHRAIAFKFLRSVNRRTPSAYASEWSIGYNVSGSLHVSVDAVRETLFHEIFHLNDSDHAIGSINWSERALRTIHDAILAQCSTRISCLTPYAPMPTMVRGGTYYAFQPNNGDAVHEYGAELATRYYREHRAIFRGEKLQSRAFKCGPKENAAAWKLFADEFFGGIDLVSAC